MDRSLSSEASPHLRFAPPPAAERALRYLDLAALLDARQVGPNALPAPVAEVAESGFETVDTALPDGPDLFPTAEPTADESKPAEVPGPAEAVWPAEASGVLGALHEVIVRLDALEDRMIMPPASTAETAPPASIGRPIGRVESFLGDVAARGFQPRGLLDVGANRGSWTRMALTIFPGMTYVLVEPQREMITSLKALAARPGCHFFNAAAGAAPGELVQTIWPDLGGSSFLPPVEEEALREGRQRRTKVITLDSILTGPCRAFSPDLVKLDIQGFELEALSGGETLFGRTELFIMEMALFEFMPRQPLVREVINFMAARAYELYDITEFGRRPHDGALGQVDLAFVKANGMFRQSIAW